MPELVFTNTDIKLSAPYVEFPVKPTAPDGQPAGSATFLFKHYTTEEKEERAKLVEKKQQEAMDAAFAQHGYSEEQLSRDAEVSKNEGGIYGSDEVKAANERIKLWYEQIIPQIRIERDDESLAILLGEIVATKKLRDKGGKVVLEDSGVETWWHKYQTKEVIEAYMAETPEEKAKTNASALKNFLTQVVLGRTVVGGDAWFSEVFKAYAKALTVSRADAKHKKLIEAGKLVGTQQRQAQEYRKQKEKEDERKKLTKSKFVDVSLDEVQYKVVESTFYLFEENKTLFDIFKVAISGVLYYNDAGIPALPENMVNKCFDEKAMPILESWEKMYTMFHAYLNVVLEKTE